MQPRIIRPTRHCVWEERGVGLVGECIHDEGGKEVSKALDEKQSVGEREFLACKCAQNESKNEMQIARKLKPAGDL